MQLSYIYILSLKERVDRKCSLVGERSDEIYTCEKKNLKGGWLSIL